MKRHLLLIAAALLSLAGHAQEKGIIKTDTLHSDILGVAKPYSVYLPAGYEGSFVHYPVLYLLHGAWGDHTDWAVSGNLRNIVSRLICSGEIPPMIIVMPDARGTDANKAGPNMGYFNMEGWPYEEHFFEEFIPHVERRYRIKADKTHRAIAGLSMGGGGAMVYGLHHPGIFGTVCPLSGLIGSFENSFSVNNYKQFARAAKANDPHEYIAGASRERLDSLRTVRWWIDCGDDDYLAEGNVRMYLLMREKNIPLEYRMHDGAHDWLYWQTALPAMLRFVATGFAKQ